MPNIAIKQKGNRKLHSMVSNKLKEYIKYKAEEEGIYCEVVDESYTTKLVLVVVMREKQDQTSSSSVLNVVTKPTQI